MYWQNINSSNKMMELNIFFIDVKVYCFQTSLTWTATIQKMTMQTGNEVSKPVVPMASPLTVFCCPVSELILK